MANVKSINGLLRANMKSRNGLLSANVKTINGVDAVVAGGASAHEYHRMDYLVGGSSLVGLTEIKFTLDDSSDYPLTGSTITTSHSWSFLAMANITALGNGVLTGELAYSGNGGAGNWVSVRAQTPIAVAVKEVLTGTQANYNGPWNLPDGIRYYVSDNGTDWTLVKEVLGTFGSGTGYIVKNVEP